MFLLRIFPKKFLYTNLHLSQISDRLGEGGCSVGKEDAAQARRPEFGSRVHLLVGAASLPCNPALKRKDPPDKIYTSRLSIHRVVQREHNCSEHVYYTSSSNSLFPYSLSPLALLAFAVELSVLSFSCK